MWGVVNAGMKLTLQASVLSFPGAAATWSQAAGDLLWGDGTDAAVFATPTTVVVPAFATASVPLVLRPNVLTPGAGYVFRLTATDTRGQVSFSTLAVTVNLPPSGGSLAVSPLAGVVLVDTFSLAAVSWVDDDLPFSYRFAYVVGTAAAEGTTVPEFLLTGAEQDSNEYSAFLPQGGGVNSTIICVSYVIDAHGAATRAGVEVSVRPAQMAVEQLAAAAESMLSYDPASNDTKAVFEAIGAVGGALNSQHNSDTSGGAATAPAAAERLSAQQALRSTLLSALINASTKMSSDSTPLAQQSSFLALITSVPQQLSSQAQTSALDFVGKLAAVAEGAGGGVPILKSVADACGDTLSSLLDSSLLDRQQAGQSSTTDHLLPSASVSESVTTDKIGRVLRSLSRAQLSGAVVGEAPAEITTKNIQMSSQRQTPAAFTSGLVLSPPKSEAHITSGASWPSFSLGSGVDLSAASSNATSAAAVDAQVLRYSKNIFRSQSISLVASDIVALSFASPDGRAIEVNNNSAGANRGNDSRALGASGIHQSTITIVIPNMDKVDFLAQTTSKSFNYTCYRNINETKVVGACPLIGNVTVHCDLPWFSTLISKDYKVACKIRSSAKCEFWDTQARAWSSRGCVTRSVTRESTVCECDHLTHFATLAEQTATEATSILSSAPGLFDLHTISQNFVVYGTFLCLWLSFPLFMYLGHRKDQKVQHQITPGDEDGIDVVAPGFGTAGGDWTVEQVEEYKRAFARFDTDGSGKISSSELRVALKEVGVEHMSAARLEALISEVDIDGEGEVDFDEFLLLMRKLAKDSEEEYSAAQMQQFREAFAKFDKDGSGNIDKEELRRALKEFGQNPSEDELEAMMKAADKEGGDGVDFAEFVNTAKGSEKFTATFKLAMLARHKYVSAINLTEQYFTRPRRVAFIYCSVMTVFFVNALLYGFKHPNYNCSEHSSDFISARALHANGTLRDDIDGQCRGSKLSCLAVDDVTGTSDVSVCDWQDADEECYLRPPAVHIPTVIVIGLLAGVVSAIPTAFISNFLQRPTPKEVEKEEAKRRAKLPTLTLVEEEEKRLRATLALRGRCGRHRQPLWRPQMVAKRATDQATAMRNLQLDSMVEVALDEVMQQGSTESDPTFTCSSGSCLSFSSSCGRKWVKALNAWVLRTRFDAQLKEEEQLEHDLRKHMLTTRQAALKELYWMGSMKPHQRLLFELNRDLISPPPALPADWCITMIWLLIFFYLSFVTIFVVLFSFRRRSEVSWAWLAAGLTQVINEVLITGPVQVLFVRTIVPKYLNPKIAPLKKQEVAQRRWSIALASQWADGHSEEATFKQGTSGTTNTTNTKRKMKRPFGAHSGVMLQTGFIYPPKSNDCLRAQIAYALRRNVVLRCDAAQAMRKALPPSAIAYAGALRSLFGVSSERWAAAQKKAAGDQMAALVGRVRMPQPMPVAVSQSVRRISDAARRISDVLRQTAAVELKVGDEVQAKSCGGEGRWQTGVLSQARPNGLFDVLFHSGRQEKRVRVQDLKSMAAVRQAKRGAGWSPCIAQRTGKQYWLNSETGETVWGDDKPGDGSDAQASSYPRPLCASTIAARSAVNGPWFLARTAEGEVYWCNRETNETAWELPVLHGDSDSEGEDNQCNGNSGVASDEVPTEVQPAAQLLETRARHSTAAVARPNSPVLLVSVGRSTGGSGVVSQNTDVAVPPPNLLEEHGGSPILHEVTEV
jgi:calmodulin